MNPDTAPTPRTDAVMLSSNWPYHITSEMQKLERELAEKTNEVARLKEINKEDLARLTEAVELGQKQAEEFDKIYDNLSAEVARLREENSKLTELFEYYYNCFDEADCERMDLEEEVARLREVCEWAADMMDGISPARGQEIRDAIARLAPAPEEA
jgi:chromosome segregation ATPase